MINWSELLSRCLSVVFSGSRYEQVFSSAPTANELSQVLTSHFPEAVLYDVTDLYSHYSGVGARLTHQVEVSWLFVPLTQLSDFIKFYRTRWLATHPDVARKFFPFINLGGGSCAGFLDAGCGVYHIYAFEPEEYFFDADQPWQDFFRYKGETICDFLNGFGEMVN